MLLKVKKISSRTVQGKGIHAKSLRETTEDKEGAIKLISDRILFCASAKVLAPEKVGLSLRNSVFSALHFYCLLDEKFSSNHEMTGHMIPRGIRVFLFDCRNDWSVFAQNVEGRSGSSRRAMSQDRGNVPKALNYSFSKLGRTHVKNKGMKGSILREKFVDAPPFSMHSHLPHNFVGSCKILRLSQQCCPVCCRRFNPQPHRKNLSDVPGPIFDDNESSILDKPNEPCFLQTKQPFSNWRSRHSQIICQLSHAVPLIRSHSARCNRSSHMLHYCISQLRHKE